MSSALWTVTLAMALGQAPPGYPGVGGPPPLTAVGGSNGYEQLYPFDAYDNWVRGHFQEMPAYGGWHFFRPYNYKHVLSQSQVAGGWGMSPTMPYAHEYFRRGQGMATREQRLSQLDAADQSEAVRWQRQQFASPTVSESAPRGISTGVSPVIMEAPAEQGINSALHTNSQRATRLDALQEQIRLQTLQLQALQNALHEEAGRGAAAPPLFRAP